MGMRSTAPARPSAWNGAPTAARRRKKRRRRDGRGGDRRLRGPPAPSREDETTAASDSRDATRRQPLGADGHDCDAWNCCETTHLSLRCLKLRAKLNFSEPTVEPRFEREHSVGPTVQQASVTSSSSAPCDPCIRGVHDLCNSRRGMRISRRLLARRKRTPAKSCSVGDPRPSSRARALPQRSPSSCTPARRGAAIVLALGLPQPPDSALRIRGARRRRRRRRRPGRARGPPAVGHRRGVHHVSETAFHGARRKKKDASG